jgi:hypothetical protein
VVPTLGTDPTKSLKVKELGKNYPETTINSLRVLKYLELTGFFVSDFFLKYPELVSFLIMIFLNTQNRRFFGK